MLPSDGCSAALSGMSTDSGVSSCVSGHLKCLCASRLTLELSWNNPLGKWLHHLSFVSTGNSYS